MLALIRGNAEGWGSGVIVALLGAAVVLLVAFVAIELRRERRCSTLAVPDPGVHRRADRRVRLPASMFAMFLYLTLYMQNILGYSPLEAGLRFLPISVLSFVVPPMSGKLAERLPFAGSWAPACCSSAAACC